MFKAAAVAAWVSVTEAQVPERQLQSWSQHSIDIFFAAYHVAYDQACRAQAGCAAW